MHREIARQFAQHCRRTLKSVEPMQKKQRSAAAGGEYLGVRATHIERRQHAEV